MEPASGNPDPRGNAGGLLTCAPYHPVAVCHEAPDVPSSATSDSCANSRAATFGQQKNPYAVRVSRCGRYWDRTSDLLGVNEALYR